MDFHLNSAMYQRFYEGAKNAGLLFDINNWMANRHPEASEDEIEDLIEAFEHADAVTKVLAYELSYYVFRHMPGPWGHLIDFFEHERNRFCNEYREKTGYQVIGNPDEDVSW
jgi:hypothetical protein